MVEQTEARRRGEEQRWNRGYCGGRRWTVALSTSMVDGGVIGGDGGR